MLYRYPACARTDTCDLGLGDYLGPWLHRSLVISTSGCCSASRAVSPYGAECMAIGTLK